MAQCGRFGHLYEMCDAQFSALEALSRDTDIVGGRLEMLVSEV
jgi:hypothetical protein